MRRRLNTTTALIAGLSLIAPAPLVAQESAAEAEPDVALICPDGSDLPCAEGVEPIPAPEESAADDATAEEPADEAAEEQPAADTEPATDAGAAEPAEEPAKAQGTEAATDEAAGTEESPVAADEEEPAAEAGTAGEDATATAPEEMTTEEPAADAVITEEATTDETTTEEATTEEATTDETTTGEAATGEPAAGEAVSDDAASEAATADDAVAADTPETTSDDQPAVASEEVPDLPVQPEAASGEAPVAAAAQAADDGTATETNVTEEVVTEETARSSDEDFANKVNEAAASVTAAAKSGKKQDDGGGLSDGEKAVLLGLGAVAVGALLSNNRKVELNSGDRVVVTRGDGSYQIIKDDNALLRQPGSTVRTETFADGSTRTTVTRPDGARIVTIRDAEYRVLRRAHVAPDGTETLLIDDTETVEPVDVRQLPPPAEQPVFSADADEDALRAALAREAALDRRFSLAQVRDIAEVRALVPVIDLNAITFETGSAAIRPDQAKSLSRLGRLIRSYIDDNPREVFLIEGHTDAVGSAAYNLALSDRRAESVALALTEYFEVPPENLVVQGYGEQFLKVRTEEAERQNRRASVRRITDLLRQASN